MTRGRPKSRFCKRGHDTELVGRYSHGGCRACVLKNDQPSPPNGIPGRTPLEVCKWGHALTEDNRYYWRGRFKGCLTCHRENGRAYRRRQGMKPTELRPVPFGPLYERVQQIGTSEFATAAARVLGVKVDSIKRTLIRGRELGFVSVNTADDLCVAIGRHPVEIYGSDWFNYGREEVADAV